MAIQPDSRSQSKSVPNPVTTLLASGWGLVSTYILFNTLFTPRDFWPKVFTMLATFCPLIAVWATIERKRWGRLALMGLSATAIGLFVAAFGAYAAIQSQDPALAARLSTDLQKLPLYESPATIGMLVLCAFANALWLRRPLVAAEFDQNKKPTLAIAQRVIATSLVGCWGVVMVASTYLPGSGLYIVNDPPAHKPIVKTNKHKHIMKSVHATSSAAM